MHSVKASCVPNHCRIYALSDPTSEDFQGTSDHVHDDLCPQCSQLEKVISTLESECPTAQCSVEVKAEMSLNRQETTS